MVCNNRVLMKLPRSAGILLHPTSLSGRDGVGTLGQAARRFIDRLASAGQSWWQVLPLNPPDFGGSPYSAGSAFAGNTMLIDLDPLRDAGWVEAAEVDTFRNEMARFDPARCPFAAVARHKSEVLNQIFERWSARPGKGHGEDFAAFCAENDDWLHDYALYEALKAEFEQRSWREWPAPYIRREPGTLEQAQKRHAHTIQRVKFTQWVLWQQWQALKDYARARGVGFIGDIPIFVAMDSADVWANREIFEIDEAGNLDEVSGVPPDYFSATGQKWGNPLYDWQALARRDYDWWLSRVRTTLKWVDVVRIDHFRGFQSYWAVPAQAETAIHGRWCSGPSDAFFEALRREFGDIPVIAEDLGMITQDVFELRDRQGLPGMKVLQFADFNDPQHIFLPQNYPENSVAYTGTHDNNTTRGWFDQLDEAQQHAVRVYLSSSDENVVRAMCEAVMRSPARLAVLPLQDVFELGAEARMNDPSGQQPSWGWRMDGALLDDGPAWHWLGALTQSSGRAHSAS